MGLRPRPTARWNDRRLVLTAVVLTTGIFLADTQSPVGVTTSALYGIVILLGLFARSPTFTIGFTIAASVLTILDFWVSPAGNLEYGVLNRGMTLVGMWVTGWLVSRYATSDRALGRSLRELADTNHALDQAAILAVTDVTGKIQYVNQKFCDISKYSRDELIGQDHRIINSGHHPKEFIRELWVTIANGGIWRGELRNRAKDGTIYWVDTTIVPFLDDRNKPYQYMAIRYDITERKRSEVLLREQAALARLGEMAAVVAHEVKNPLAGIRGALQVIGGRMTAGTRDRAIIGEIVARLDSLNEIVHDLLVFARPRDPKLAPVAIADLIDTTASLLRKDPEHAALQVHIGGATPMIVADAEQLQTVFVNLLLNAAQASGSTGEVRVQISERNGTCEIAIADQGPGIPPDVREKIFEPFFTTKHRGTGLGLPTAKRVVERHRGSITFDCPASGGTVVTVTLPSA